jgi:hypothetical protein
MRRASCCRGLNGLGSVAGVRTGPRADSRGPPGTGTPRSLRADPPAVRIDHRPADRLLQLANVPRPIVGLQRPAGRGGQATDRNAAATRIDTKEMRDQQRDVLAPLPQRRCGPNRNRDSAAARAANQAFETLDPFHRVTLEKWGRRESHRRLARLSRRCRALLPQTNCSRIVLASAVGGVTYAPGGEHRRWTAVKWPADHIEYPHRRPRRGTGITETAVALPLPLWTATLEDGSAYTVEAGLDTVDSS